MILEERLKTQLETAKNLALKSYYEGDSPEIVEKFVNTWLSYVNVYYNKLHENRLKRMREAGL